LVGGLACLAAGCQWMAHGQNAEGVRMFQQAYYQGALDKFHTAIQTDPKNADGYYNLAATYHRLGNLQHKEDDLQQADNYYHQCLVHDPNHEDCYRGLAVLLTERGKSADAFALLEDWSQRNPTLAGPKIELARLHEEAGDRDGATNKLIEAVAADPNNAKALAALGKLREEAGNTAQALQNYQRSLTLNRFQPQVAARVASLQGALVPPPLTTPPGGTRVVTSPATIR